MYPAHIPQIKSSFPLLLQILQSIISDGYITAYKWMNHNWFNPLSLYNWEIIELFSFFILWVVTVLNIFVCKSHPSPSTFLHAWSSDYLNVLPLLFSLSGTLYNQLLSILSAFCLPTCFPSLTLHNTVFWCLSWSPF